jgi:hypothetical protein
MNAKNNKLKMFLKVVLLGACACGGATTCAATYTWKADENGNWDGNITDPAHWECDTADQSGYPQSKNDVINIPKGVKTKITINSSHESGKWVLLDSCHVTFVSAVDAIGDTAQMNVKELSVKAGATFVLNSAKILNDSAMVFPYGSTGIVHNASSLRCGNINFHDGKSSAYIEVAGKSTLNAGNIYIGDGNKLVIDDSTVICRARLALGTYSYANRVNSSTIVRFKGREPKLLFYDDTYTNGKNLQVCLSNSKMVGDVLNFEFLIPEEGFASAPIAIAEGNSSSHLFATTWDSDKTKTYYGLFRFKILEESPAVLCCRKVNQKLVEWTLRGENEEGFCRDAMEEGIPPKKAREQTFSFEEPTENRFIYSVLLDCRPTGCKVIVR